LKFFDLRAFSNLNMVITFGIIVVSNILVALVAGYYLDKWTFNNKLLLIVFVFLGVASGLYNGIRYLLKEVDRLERTERKRKAVHDRDSDNHAD